VRGVFVDANESLAVIFERLEEPGNPKVRTRSGYYATKEQASAGTGKGPSK